ncbi:hypothetical protein M501DRAFT_989352 [Patellaria atrata CBS 101060]|uniref:Uncharacterized protein n=1 Tax=Patellaria atrata CBS 101060 TaxID=1346257 RepID=A0A9P4S2A4_9PEZI|nr:hypothetical protein M501DRAFT_989352 [Patellaria atrata CBS 101060]
MPLFGNRHSADHTTANSRATRTDTTPKRSSTLFGRRRSSSSVSDRDNHTSPRRGLFNRQEDPSIVGARERVLRAEAAERDADRALIQARGAVRGAREEVKRLEREAAEEARLAKIKQSQAKSISKRAKPLGRHDHI